MLKYTRKWQSRERCLYIFLRHRWTASQAETSGDVRRGSDRREAHSMSAEMTSEGCPVSHPIPKTNEQELLDAKPTEQIPGPKSYPLIGTLYKYLPFVGDYTIGRIQQGLIKKHQQYGNLVRERVVPGFVQYLVFDPDDIAKVFRHEGKYPNRIPFPGVEIYEKARGLRHGSFTANGEDWHSQRSRTQPLLMGPRNVAAYIPYQGPITQDFVDRMARIRDSNGEVPNFHHELHKWALETIGIVCFDSRLGALADDIDPESDVAQFIDAVAGSFESIYRTTMYQPLFLNRFSRTLKLLFNQLDIINEVTARQIKLAFSLPPGDERLVVPTEHSLMKRLSHVVGLTDDELHVAVRDQFLGGIDSTAHTIGFNLYLLARNPDKQEKLYEEVQRVAPPGTPLTPNLIEKLNYVKQCVKETARLFNVGGGTVRQLDHDIVLSGYRVPANSFIILFGGVSGRQEKYFPEPEKFLPERWDRKTGQGKVHPFTQITFGFGPRMCLGRRFAEQETYLGLIKIIQRFRVEYHHGDIDVVQRLLGMPDKPLRFKFIDR